MESFDNGTNGGHGLLRTGVLKDLADGFSILVDGSAVTFDCEKRKLPMGKITSTQSFTLTLSNLINGAQGILKLVTNTASAITISFPGAYTHKTLNTTFTTYTFPAVTGKDYYLSFIVDGSNIEWVIGDINGTPGIYQSHTMVFGSGFSTPPSGVTLRYTYLNKRCHIYGEATGNGISNGVASTTGTLPIAAANTVIQEGLIGTVVDNAAAAVGLIRTRLNSTTCDFLKSLSTAYSATNGQNKRPFLYLNFTYETV